MIEVLTILETRARENSERQRLASVYLIRRRCRSMRICFFIGIKQHTVWASEGSRSPDGADSVSICTVFEDIPVLCVGLQSSCFDLDGEVNIVAREGLPG